MRTFFSLVMALILTACGGSDGTDGRSSSDGASGPGQGGSGAGTTSAAGGDTGSGASSSGGSEKCFPTMENDHCASAQTCSCPEMTVVIPDAACPADTGNVCTPGHNQCGCDLKGGEDYQAPSCLPFIDGDLWRLVGGEDDFVSFKLGDTGQYIGSFGSLTGPTVDDYFTGFTVSASIFSWNLANSASHESAEGTISPDCKTIEISYRKAGELRSYKTDQLVHITG